MIQIPESILRRNDQRQDDLQKKKDEGPTQGDIFRETFKEQQIHIENLLNSLNEIKDRNKIAETFSQISKDLSTLNRYLSTSSMFLIPYDIKISKSVIHDLQEKSNELEKKLLPKKKFGFTQRKDLKNNIFKKEEKIEEKTETIETETNQFGFADRNAEKLILRHEDVENKDIMLRRLENCDVIINGGPNTLHIVAIRNCRIFSGPVSTSVLVEDCKDSIFAFPCQQLRIHNTMDSDFYIHVTTKAIIEDSKKVRFAPYNYSYADIDKHFKASGLHRNINNWNDIDDFNWLVSNKQSPNWSILPENERIEL